MYNKVELCGMNTAKLPVLTEAEKRELLARAHAGDAAAREQMVEGNLRPVSYTHLDVYKRQVYTLLPIMSI